MSPSTWKAAKLAAERAIPVLDAKGHMHLAAELAQRAKQFAERADG